MAQGTITSDGVLVQSVTLYGLRLAGAAGRFAIPQFEAVLVERSSGPIDAQGGRNERVFLAGCEGTPNILVARTERGAGMTLGRELADPLHLAYRETRIPY